MRRPALWVLLVLVGLLSACSRPEALSEPPLLVNTLAPQPPALPGLPSQRQIERAVAYRAGSGRSPFQAALPDQLVAGLAEPVSAASVPGPVNRTLGEYPLNQLRFVGTLSGVGLGRERIEALIQDGDGRLHRVSVGERFSREEARVLSITEHAVQWSVKETDAAGGWIERQHQWVLSES